jgi:hypothetical protein
MYDTTMYGTTSQTDISAILGTYAILVLVIAVIMIVANWKIYTKAGKPGWASIVPFYNMYVMYEIAGMNGWMFLLTFIPIVNIVIQIMLYLNLAKKFGKSTGFAIGLILLNPIFLLLLAFGNAEYNK